MKKILLAFTLLVLTVAITANAFENGWTKKKAKKWLKKKEWASGLQLTPHKTINAVEFAKQYHANKKYWDEAFEYLRTHDLANLPVGKSQIDGENVTVSVTQDPSKDLDKTNWESHKKFVDIQSVIAGEEKIGIHPVAQSTITKLYDDKKDVTNYSADGKYYSAKPGTFFLFFPGDAHRPNITPGGNKPVKKIVIKVRAADNL